MGPLKEQLKALEHLQELDLKIDQIQKNKESLPGALKVLNEQLKKVEFQVTAKKNSVAEVEKVQKQNRAALDLNKDRLTRSSARLEGVQNSTEFQAINKEIDQLNKLNLTLEEQLKKATVDMEMLAKSLGEIQTQHDSVEGERSTESAKISGQESQYAGELGTLKTQRTRYTESIEKRTLALYDRVRVQRAGLGIVPAVSGRCKGCNMVLPPQLYIQVQKCVELLSCPSCHRILFVPGSDDAKA